MGLFGRRRDGDFSSMSEAERQGAIARLEAERDEINQKIEKLLRSYERRTGDRSAIRGARKLGRSPKDFAYLERKILKK